MSSTAQFIRGKAELIATFIAAQRKAVALPRPLLVSMQGPQGCGKSTLAAALVDVLREDHALKCAVASMDDFYLTHAGLKDVARQNPENALLQGRGPPGTHDLPLLARVLDQLHQQPSKEQPVRLPVFDKSLHDGEGDRSEETVTLDSPLDVFVLEGWSLGYGPAAESVARPKWAKGRTASQHPWATLATINANLAAVEGQIGDKFDAHVRITPLSYDYVYTWRLEQEHKMKAKNGGKGMGDEAVRAFVDRYMPVYEVFGEVTPARETLELVFDKERAVVKRE